MTFSHTLPHPHNNYANLRSSSPSHSPNSVKRRSLPMDDDLHFSYDFPQYAFVPPSPQVDPLALSTSLGAPSSGSGATRSRNALPSSRSTTHPIASGSASRDQPPPLASARFFNNHAAYPGTAPISSSSGFTSTANRARGPSFASTASHTSSSTTSSGSSSGAPATPPCSSHPLTLGTPPATSARVLRPYWERSHPLAVDDEEGRLDEGPEDELRQKETLADVRRVDVSPEEEDDSDGELGYDPRDSTDAEFARYMAYLSPSMQSALSGKPQPPRRPRSIRRSPFADDDPSQPHSYSQVYLDDDYPPVAARRFSGPASPMRKKRLTDSPSSLARSASLTHGYGRVSPRGVNSPIMVNSVSGFGSGSGSGSRPQSPALTTHSPSYSSGNSPAHSTLLLTNVRGSSPSPLHLSLPVRDISNSPSLNIPEPSPDVDASPLRTALLLNSGRDLSLTRTSSGQPYEERAGDRRFSGRGLSLNGLGYGGGSSGLELQGLGGGAGSINAALARRRAEWTEFEGDEYSVSGYEGRTRPHAPRPRSHLVNEEDDAMDLGSRWDRYGYGYGRGGLNLNLDDDACEAQDEEVQEVERDERRANVDLSSPRTSLTFTRPHPYARISSPMEKRRSMSQSILQQTGGVSYTYAYDHDPDQFDDERQSVHADRPSTSGEHSVDNENEKGAGRGQGGEEVPTCFAIRWGLRARWTALKLRVTLGAFRARRRVGLA